MNGCCYGRLGKGQITLPKSIRQAMGVDSGDKIKFHLKDDQVVVTRINENLHEDPAIKSLRNL
ncbi:MAG: type II toxin-antitoxin system PrlF family antitoxin [Desulfobacteraceae bacterium]|nr:type II toxin-antitoxin system PrlF family antitoxin [Desulfobacteraceae bacterium]